MMSGVLKYGDGHSKPYFKKKTQKKLQMFKKKTFGAALVNIIPAKQVRIVTTSMLAC